jgi:hypothetical protein
MVYNITPIYLELGEALQSPIYGDVQITYNSGS